MKYVSFALEIHYTTDANSRHGRGLLPGSSSLVAKFIPVFVKSTEVVSYSSRYSHTTTINLSSIVFLDFLPPLVITSLLEQAPDWFMRCEYPPKFTFFNLRVKHPKRSICTAPFVPQDCLSRLCIDLTYKSFASGVNTPIVCNGLSY